MARLAMVVLVVVASGCGTRADDAWLPAKPDALTSISVDAGALEQSLDDRRTMGVIAFKRDGRGVPVHLICLWSDLTWTLNEHRTGCTSNQALATGAVRADGVLDDVPFQRLNGASGIHRSEVAVRVNGEEVPRWPPPAPWVVDQGGPGPWLPPHHENLSTVQLGVGVEPIQSLQPGAPPISIYADMDGRQGADLCVLIRPDRTWELAGKLPGHEGTYKDILAIGKVGTDGTLVGLPEDMLMGARHVWSTRPARINGADVPGSVAP